MVKEVKRLKKKIIICALISIILFTNICYADNSISEKLFNYLCTDEYGNVETATYIDNPINTKIM